MTGKYQFIHVRDICGVGDVTKHVFHLVIGNKTILEMVIQADLPRQVVNDLVRLHESHCLEGNDNEFPFGKMKEYLLTGRTTYKGRNYYDD